MGNITVARPEKCVGCRSCEMICSLTNEGVCSPFLSNIKVDFDLFTAEANISIAPECSSCKKCLQWCPAGVLSYRKD